MYIRFQMSEATVHMVYVTCFGGGRWKGGDTHGGHFGTHQIMHPSHMSLVKLKHVASNVTHSCLCLYRSVALVSEFLPLM